MHLTEAQQEEGRRSFGRAVAGTRALAELGSGAPLGAPRRGGPVKAALIGPGLQGKILLSALPKGWIDLRALCDINPGHTREAAAALTQNGWGKPREYQDYKQMLEKEDLEAVLIATPLWTHVEITQACLRAGKHVLCEKMMAWDLPGCHRMQEEARKAGRLLEIGYHRFHSAGYQAAYEAIIRPQLLGDIHHVRATWHRSRSWRRTEKPPSPEFDPRPWGYDSWDHLVNWRLYRKYSRGLLAELGSHQISIANWFLGAVPEAVYTSGAVGRKDGREAFDHVFTTFDYPGGRTVTFSSIETNAHDGTYEQVMGTKGTLVLAGNGEGFLFTERNAAAAAAAAAPAPGTPIPSVRGPEPPPNAPRTAWWLAYRHEIAGFCAAIREGAPLRCGPEKALGSAGACIRAEEAGYQKTRLALDWQKQPATIVHGR
jgi:predicted dehydrogenase